MSLTFGCAVVLATVATASAGQLNLWTAGACPGGLPAFNSAPGNATVWLAPTDQNATLASRYGVTAAALGYDTTDLFIMGDVLPW